MSKILILIAGHVCTAPRAQKEADTLAAAGHDVVVRGTWFDDALVERDRELMADRQWRLDPILDLRPTSVSARSRNLGVRARGRLAREMHRRFGKFSPSQLGFAPGAMLKAALSEGADLTIVHSEAGLWVGEQLLKKGMRVGVDFEDWFSEDLLPQDRIGRPVAQIRSYEAELIRRCDYRITTSQALAQALAEAYAAPAPEVVYNVFPFADRAEMDGEMRDRADRRIPSFHWFSQTIGPGRGLETLLASLNYVSVPVEIHLRGNCTESARQWIDELTPPAWRDRVFIHPTVPNRELLSRIAEHDIGLALETPEIVSRNLTITNKLFQYLQAGLAVIATNTAGQREVFARRPNIGTLIPPDDPRALALAIEALLSDPEKLSAARAAAVRAAEEEFCWEKQQPKLLTAAEAALQAKAPKPSSANLKFATAPQTMTQQRHVLIVSPNFPPINTPDHQRVRMSLPHLAEFGWRATVLAVAPEYVEGLQDPLLLETVPKTARVVRTRALSAKRTRRFGVGNLALRSFPFLKREGDRLLSSEHFDLVFFSTTAFPVMALGRRWLKRWGVPYVLDFQDPWLSDYFSDRTDIPPGGHFKYGLSQKLAQFMEPYTVRKASHIITVSPAYRESLLQRYSWLSSDRFTVLPFGAAENDFEIMASLDLQQKVFNPRDGKRHWVYVGAGGTAMTFSIRSFFQALGRARSNGSGRELENLMIHFIGTDYAAGDRARETFRPVAAEYGVADIVEEIPNRIPYFEALKCLKDAEALIVPGSDDPGYTASKICVYVMANKPMLAIFHEDSSAVSVLRDAGAGTVVTFKDRTEVERMTSEIEAKWFKSVREPATIDRVALEPYLAREMTRRQCAVFDQCVAK